MKPDNIFKDKKVGFFGIQGSFTHKTALDYFGSDNKFVSTSKFRDIFQKVHGGELDYGVVPIENTLAGSIYENYDLLEEYKLFIIGEVNARISHSLMVNSKIADGKSSKKLIEDIKEVYSHEKALDQCSDFFKSHPWIKPVAYTSTAHAAELISKSQDKTMAAIADSDNTDLYDLKVVKSDIENNKYNYTRFLLIQKNKMVIPKANKCSLLIHLAHETGSLSGALELLSKLGCNLTKIESRPVRTQPFDYVFYIDFIFDENFHNLDAIIDKLKTKTLDIRVFGVYNVA